MATDHSSRNTTVVLPGFKPVDTSRPKWDYANLVGRKFGKLTVVKYAGRRHVSGGTQVAWICRCECGKKTLVTSTGLTGGRHLSCGCATSARNWKHRKTNIRHHPLYGIWNGIIGRTRKHIDYIARGMCDGFRELDHFAAVMGERPSAEHSIDRVRNDDGYWCGCCEECVSLGRTKNVRWATQDVQANNKGNNRRLTYQGRTQTLSQWAKELGVDRARIGARLKLGWTEERALAIRKLGNAHSLNDIHASEETQAQCADEYLAGATLSELGVKYSCDRHSITRLLKRLGIQLRSRSERMKVGLSKRRRRGTNGHRLLF